MKKIDNLLKNYQEKVSFIEENIGNHLTNNWGKYLGGAGALGAGALAANHFMGDDTVPESEVSVTPQVDTYTENPGSRVADAASQNAQSAATQAEQDLISGAPAPAAPGSNFLSFKDAWSGNNENVGGTYDRLAGAGADAKNGLRNAYQAVEQAAAPKGPQIR